ncbi:uncharacterized protein V1513DRAFT_435403, partial [Lipomyces chichibuensis]|uniref:uncharacterized protein n=1 Tax=Lipomyces chichibuensis TaxID=1546026 RepID=UPI0033436C6A
MMERITSHFYLCMPFHWRKLRALHVLLESCPWIQVYRLSDRNTPDGEVLELGKADVGHHRIEAMQIRRSVKGLLHKKRWRMKEQAAMICRRIRNLVDDLNCRTAQFLCSSYNLVLLPKFERQQTVRGRGGESHGHLVPLPVPATPSRHGKGVPLVPCCAGQRRPHKQDLRSTRAS